MKNTTVKDVMEKNPEIISPDTTLLEACNKMKELDCGSLPVGSEDKPQGMITDRDIVVRAICNGADPATSTVRDFMTTTLCSCNEDDTLIEAAEAMNKYNVSRITVKDESGHITGILSFGHILRSSAADNEEIAETVYRATGRKKAA